MASGAGQRVLQSGAQAQPLGQNSNILNRGPDSALLKPSIRTSVTGVRQIIKALEVGNTEVRDYLLNEVNIVYECKCCMNMFRSLANLTAHKRSYCLEKFENVTHVFSSKTNCQSANLKTVIIEGETIDTVVPEDTLDEENYSPSLDLLKDAGIISTLEERPLINRLLPPKKASLQSVVEKLAARKYLEGAADKVETEEANTATDALCLEEIRQTNKAKFQSYTTGFKYREVQALNNQISLIVGPDGKEILPDRSKSPTNSEESKENDEDFATVDDNGNNMKYPCPECKKGFSKIGNVYKHLSNTHGKRKEEYTKLRQEIQDSAYVVGKTEAEGKPQKNHLHNIALAIGLVNKTGVGMQKINKTQEKEEKTLEHQPRPRGRPPKKQALELSPTDSNDNADDSDTEVSFNPESLSPDAGGGGHVRRKRKRGETSRVPITSAWKGGAFQCVLCERSFGTPTFLMQHYVSPHFSRELRNEFQPCLPKKRCPQCKSTFDTETKLLMHLGCTHREVHKYLPSNAKELMPGTRSPTKIMKTPLRAPAPTADLFQKFSSNLVKGGGKADKKSSPKSSSPGGGSIPHLEDEFMT